MKWIHKVDPLWLEARRKYITASAVQSLLPTTPTGRKRDQFDALVTILAEKNRTVLDSDVVSYGAEARGHLLEPYAIQARNEVNANLAHPNPVLRHWDDRLVTNGVSAFSPDALDLYVDGYGDSIEIDHLAVPASTIGEVKSYDAAKHYKKGIADSSSLEERWQIAFAMYVAGRIVNGELILFNPYCEDPIFIRHYTRASLYKEMCVIDDAMHYVHENRALISNRFREAASGYPIIDIDTMHNEITKQIALDYVY